MVMQGIPTSVHERLPLETSTTVLYMYDNNVLSISLRHCVNNLDGGLVVHAQKLL